MTRVTYTIDSFPVRENFAVIYDMRKLTRAMDFSLQRAVLLVLGGLVPAAVFTAERAEFVVVVTLVNVLLIWASLRIATGGTLLGFGRDAADPERT